MHKGEKLTKAQMRTKRLIDTALAYERAAWPLETEARREFFDARSDIEDALAHPVSISQVKRLEWSREPPYHVVRMSPLCGTYSIEHCDGLPAPWQLNGWYARIGLYDTFNEAKEAAQADFELRLSTFLTQATPDPVLALHAVVDSGVILGGGNESVSKESMDKCRAAIVEIKPPVITAPPAFVAAAERYLASVAALGEQSGYNHLTYFETPILKAPTDEIGDECHRRWVELNEAGKALRAALTTQGGGDGW